MTKGIHRVAAGTKSARKLMARSMKGVVEWQPPALRTEAQREIDAWNAEVERRKDAKKQQK